MVSRCALALGLVALGLLVPRADAAIYWANTNPVASSCSSPPGTIARANLDGTLVDQAFIAGIDRPVGVAVDGGHVYWSALGVCQGTIGRANLDGSAVNTSFIGGVGGPSGPSGIAVDSFYIYWGNLAGYASIGTADLDGTNVDELFIPGAAGPCAVAVDADHVYWANSGINTASPDANAIGRADYNGDNVNQTFITGANTPCGVAVDSTHVYWTNSGGSTIGRANLDGSSPDQSFIGGATNPCGVAVDDSHIYWANRGTGTIGRANLDGSSPQQNFITGAANPCGVAVDTVVVHAVAPVNTAPPAISGNPSAGQTLSCSQGAWSGTSPKSYGFRWLRDGSPIEGATGASYVVMDVDQGHALTCQVTAHNEAGDATATSAAVQVPTPAANTVAVSGIGTPVPTPANLRASGLKVGARSLVLTLQCRGVAGQICKGKVTLSARRGRGKQVTVGSASFSIAAGKSKRLTIGLNKTGRSMLRHSRSLPARLTVALTGAAKPIVSKAIAFKKKRR